jgi:hypothetical protein
MPLPLRLKLACGPYTWTSTLPQRPFVPGRHALGGEDESWAGVPEKWVDRKDRLLTLRPRFTEDEWPELADVVEHAQTTGAALAVWPDAAAAGTSYETYLIAPKMNEKLRPEPSQPDGYFEIGLEVRTTDGSAIEPVYFTA